MNWQQLRYFEVLAREEHYTKAAEQLFITQPALSKAISSLEGDIGVPLFEQHGRQVKLTRYGKIFYNYVRRATHDIDDGLAVLHEMINSDRGTVRIGSIFTIMTDILPKLIWNFLIGHPNVKFSTRQQSTKETLHYLSEDEIDLAFVAEYDEEQDAYQKFERSLIFIEDIDIAVSMNHPFADRSEVRFDELLDETFIFYNDTTGMSRSIPLLLENAGYDISKLKISFLATEDNSILGLVRAGLGIAFITEAPNVNTTGVSILKVTDIYLYRNVYMVWKQERYMSPVVKAFRNFVLNETSSGPTNRRKP